MIVKSRVQKLGILLACASVGLVRLRFGPIRHPRLRGHSVVGITVEELTQVISGWSAKKSILGKPVYNENGKKIGKALDLIVTPEKNVSYLIIGAGGFIGIARHDVAIPVSQVQEKAGKLVIAGATEAAVKAMPEFQYDAKK